jgi:hypothetical protein
MIEAIGYLAAVVTFAGFLTNDLAKVRLCSLVACGVWIAYGSLIGSGSILLCNFIIGALQVFKLIQSRNSKKAIQIQELTTYKLEIEQEMRDNCDANLDWEWDQVNNKLKKLTKKF